MLPVASLLSTGDDSVQCAGQPRRSNYVINRRVVEAEKAGEKRSVPSTTPVSTAVQRYTWLPFTHPSDPCKLTCRAKGHHFYSNLAERVVDGTPCAGATTNPSAVCVQGECQEVGCDDVVGSPLRLDACGVCRGDNSTCRKISGIFARQDLTRGLNEIIVIPAGSTRIRIKGLRYSTNSLALQTAEGDTILNGGEKRSQGKEFEAAGTMFSYKTKRRCAGQCLVAHGPTDRSLKLMLNTRGRNRGVMYSFNVPINVSDGYYRRIIDTVRPRAGLVKSAILPATDRQQRGGDNGRDPRGHGHVHIDSQSGSSDSSSGSRTDNNNNNHEGPRPSPLKDTESEDNVDRDDSFSHDNSNGNRANNERRSEDGDKAPAEGQEAVGSVVTPGHSRKHVQANRISQPIANPADSESSRVPGDDVEPAMVDHKDDKSLDSVDEEVGAPEPLAQRQEDDGYMKITRKEKPRFIDDYDRTNGLSAGEARTFEFQSNAHSGMHSREGGADAGNSHQSAAQHRSEMRSSDSVNADNVETTPTVGHDIDPSEAESSVEGLSQDAAPYISQSPTDQSDTMEPSVPGSDSVHLPQSDSPTSRYYKSYRSRTRQNRNRPWRHFRRPKYSQSFTFRRRPSQPEDAEGSASRGSRPAYTAVVHTTNSRRIRYRQQPQVQGSEGGRPASISAASSRQNSYSGSGNSGYVYNRQTPSQRQALTAGQSGSQDQARNLQPSNENSQPQRENAQDSNVRQQSISPGRETPSSQLEEYRRQLSRRRQLIEQHIAAQNAEYQRRLEERNQRLKQQHSERQHRHNDSRTSHHSSQQYQSPNNPDRQTLPQERTPSQPTVNVSTGSPGSARSVVYGASSRQSGASPQRTPDPRLESSGLNNEDAKAGSGDRRRPLIISNRRQDFQQERNPVESSVSQSGRPASGSGYAGSRASARQPGGTASPQRIVNSRLTPASDGRRPLIISNRRQDPSHQDRSPPESPVSSSRALPGLPRVISNQKQTSQEGNTPITPARSPSRRVDNVGIGGPVIPSSGVDGNSQHSDGRWPRIISSRRQTAQQRQNPLTPPVSSSGGLPGRSEGVEVGASNTPVIPSSGRSSASGNPEQFDGRRPLIISNRRQDSQQGRSPLTTSQSPSGEPPGFNVDSASLPRSSGQIGADSGVDNLQRRQPLILSNRRQTPQQGRNSDASSGRSSPGYSDSSGRGVTSSQRTSSLGQNSVTGNLDGADRRRPLIISNRRQSPQKEQNLPVASRTPTGGRPRHPDSAASGVLIPRVSSVPGPVSLDNNPQNADRRAPLVISNRRQDPVLPGGAEGSGPAVSKAAPESESGLHLGRRVEDQYRPVHTPAPAVVPGQQPANPDLIPNTASLGGGFVPPQYIPETGSQYRSHPSLPGSSSNQLSGSVESPLVTGPEGNALPGVLESGPAIGGAGNVLAIGETDDVISYEWRVSGLTECTLTCGGGIQQTVVVCLDTVTQAYVTDDNCQHMQKPQTKGLTCNTRPCPAQWMPGEWSACSVSCGRGEQTRLVSCVARISATLNVTMADDNCQLAEKPELRQACQNEACNRWRVGNWSKCSVDCGEGVRTRDVYCTDQTGFDVSDELCSGSGSKPSTQEACVTEACGKGWYYTEWPEQCPARCGSGDKRRHVACVGDGGSVLADSSCDLSSRPQTHQACSADRSCGGDWFTGEWTQCNVTCGKGYQERDVICVRGVAEGLPSMVEEENCAAEAKPTTMQSCEMSACVSQWYMTSWSQCSQSCGTGQRTRGVKCLDPQQRSSSDCPLAEKPASREACNTASCVTTPAPTPRVSDCQDTFSRCQLVKHARMCRFTYYKKKCCATCSTST